MTTYTRSCITLILLFTLNILTAQNPPQVKDSTKKATKELPLEPTTKSQIYY